MRKDMSKVVSDSRRCGGSGPDGAKKVHKKDWDTAVTHEGMLKPHRLNWSGKESNATNLSPFRRFIESRVGKPWDDVYSEICEHFKTASAVQSRMRMYIGWFVETNISFGKHGGLYDGGHKFDPNDTYMPMWVDPTDGILKQCGRKKQLSYRDKMKAEEELTTFTLDDGSTARKKDGVWYQCVIEPVPPVVKKIITYHDGSSHETEVGGSAYDVIKDKMVYLRDSSRRWHTQMTATHYVKSKRQLNHKELKQNGLMND